MHILYNFGSLKLISSRSIAGLFQISFLIFLLFTYCSGRFVVREKLKELNKKWAEDKIYLLNENVDVGNGEIVKKGTKIKIWIVSDSFSVKVKAYEHTQSREKAIGKNIIFMYEAQFKNEDFERKPFEDALAKLLTDITPKKTSKEGGTKK
jgi:type II secretion system-associated lipoprotein